MSRLASDKTRFCILFLKINSKMNFKNTIKQVETRLIASLRKLSNNHNLHLHFFPLTFFEIIARQPRNQRFSNRYCPKRACFVHI